MPSKNPSITPTSSSREIFPSLFLSAGANSSGNIVTEVLGCWLLFSTTLELTMFSTLDSARDDMLELTWGVFDSEEETETAFSSIARTLNSVLRFCCLPSSVSLDAIGFENPYPLKDNLVLSIHVELRKSTTDFARASESFKL